MMFLLAIVDVLALIVLGAVAVAMLQRDLPQAPFLIRLAFAASAFLCFSLAINRLNLMSFGQPTSYWMRVCLDCALAARSVLWFREGEKTADWHGPASMRRPDMKPR